MTMLVADADNRWTIVHQEHGEPLVRRYPVPGGWLYQVSIQLYPDILTSFHPPVFVPFVPERE